MLRFFFFLFCIPLISLAAPSPGEFLSQHHLPLLVRVSADSDFRIKLVRGGAVEAEQQSEKKIGKWSATHNTLSITFGDKKLSYQLKLAPNSKTAAKYDLLISGKSPVFTHREEMILDVNLPEIPTSVKNKCLKNLQAVAKATLSAGPELFAHVTGQRDKYKVNGEGRMQASYIQSGFIAEASIDFLSEAGWDCLYNASFRVDLKAETCGLTQFSLNHCAQ